MIVQSKLTIVEVVINARISDNTTRRMFNQFSWMEMEEVIEAAMQRHCFDKCFEFNLIPTSAIMPASSYQCPGQQL
jgi:hypothetical protein